MKRKKIIAVIAVSVFLALCITVICLVRMDYGANRYEGYLYFLNETATSIESECRNIRYSDEQDLAEEVIKELMRGPEDSKHQRIIAKQTGLLSVDGVDTGNVLVNFSREFQTGDSQKDILAVYAVVKSICSMEGIYSVKVIVEGTDIITADGSIIGYLTDQDINLSTDTYNSEMREVTLYFPSKSDNILHAETRSIRVNDQQPLAQYIINELIKGPSADGLSDSLSKDTVLISVETSNNVCFVNFKSSFLDKNSGSAEKEKMVVFSIVDSLTELDAINRVQFLMDGRKIDLFGNINIGSMFGRDDSLIG